MENIIKDIEIKLEKFVEKHNKLISEHIILKEENKVISADLKAKNPVSYGAFLEKFTSIKNQLKSKGVLQ